MENTENYLECERNRVYYTLIAIAGFFGAYTFLLRGKVFCNAQTGNLVLLGLAIGQAEWETAAYYLFPISAYMAGAFISELLPNPVKYHLKIRWDTVILTVCQNLTIRFLPHFPLKWKYQILTEEGALIDKR